MTIFWTSVRSFLEVLIGEEEVAALLWVVSNDFVRRLEELAETVPRGRLGADERCAPAGFRVERNEVRLEKAVAVFERFCPRSGRLPLGSDVGDVGCLCEHVMLRVVARAKTEEVGKSDCKLSALEHRRAGNPIVTHALEQARRALGNALAAEHAGMVRGEPFGCGCLVGANHRLFDVGDLRHPIADAVPDPRAPGILDDKAAGRLLLFCRLDKHVVVVPDQHHRVPSRHERLPVKRKLPLIVVRWKDVNGVALSVGREVTFGANLGLVDALVCAGKHVRL